MTSLTEGTVLDGFLIGACLYAGGMARIHSVQYAHQGPHGFPMVMKVPRMGTHDGAENIVGFEVEHMLMQQLQGPHVPRFVAAGDLARTPYLVMEHIRGRPLEHWLDEAIRTGTRPTVDEVARLGAALATAAHSLHRQDAVHLDIKPGNVLIRDDGSAVLIDFGLSWHAHLPDLLAEEMRRAVGSPVYISPEQVVGVRGDPRSDVFAIGVVLYELLTGELPFGASTTTAGMRQRLWMDPAPPRRHRPDLPDWMQEIVLRCLEPAAADRYPSAAQLAFDLTHPGQVRVGERGTRTRGTGFGAHFRRWVRAAGLQYRPSPLPSRQIDESPIVMVAVPWKDVSDATLYSLRQAVSRSLGIRPGARLMCVTVADAGTGGDTAMVTHMSRLLAMLHDWSRPLDLRDHQTSHHVLEHGDVAQALLQYARANHVNMIVMGAATHGLRLQGVVPTVPIRVAMGAPCTVILVKQELPFGMLGESAAQGMPPAHAAPEAQALT